MKDTIGLIHPSSEWHKDSKTLRGQEIEVLNITESNVSPGWYCGRVRLVNPPKVFKCIANNMHMNRFRPRRVK